ncbi:hypothetical protein D3C87_1619910 [compost metagenome]
MRTGHGTVELAHRHPVAARFGVGKYRRRHGREDHQGIGRRDQGRAAVHDQRAGDGGAADAGPARAGRVVEHRHHGGHSRDGAAGHALLVAERSRTRFRHRQLCATRDDAALRGQGPSDRRAGRRGLDQRVLQEGLPHAIRRQGHEGARVAIGGIEDLLGLAQHEWRSTAFL